MPELPSPLPEAIGFAKPDGIYVTKADWALLIARDVGLRAWIEAAADCLAVQ